MCLDLLKPATFAPKCKVPALFLHAIDDHLVPKAHTEENFEAYGGEKAALYFEGDHNSRRPEDILEEVV